LDGTSLASSCGRRLPEQRTTKEARGAESRADFAHKVSIAAKELRESRYWLRLIEESRLGPAGLMDGLGNEANQLISILTASAKTAKMAS
jgi:four helix bundle protein